MPDAGARPINRHSNLPQLRSKPKNGLPDEENEADFENS